MTDQQPEGVEYLDPTVDDQREIGEHPDEVTEQEAAEGEAMYHRIDDLDDDCTGLEGDDDAGA